MKQLISEIQSFAYSNGKDTKQVMGDLLSFIIGNFNPCPEPDKTWRYTKAQNAEFHAMFLSYLRVMDEQLRHAEWFDAWGDLFMSLTPSGGSRGQFFTPTSICDLMADITIAGRTDDDDSGTPCGIFGRRVMVSDPAAGSSRNLLATYARFMHDKRRKPYLVAEDIDLMCCKMSAVNLMMHGCFGEVICHNTLADPKGLLVGYVINADLCTLGLPTIRVSRQPEMFVTLR